MSTLPAAPPIYSARFAEITRGWVERAELIDGEINVLPPPSFLHQAIVLNLTRALDGWVEAGPGRGMVFPSPIDVLLGPHDRVQPDLAWWSGGVDLDVQPAPPPDLAVEVLSPSTRRRDVGPKRLAYERAGVAELWLVDPVGRTVTVLLRSGGDGFDVVLAHGEGEDVETPLMAGLALPVTPLFPA